MILLLPAVVLVLAGASVHYVTRRIAQDRIGLNSLLGIRTKYTMASEQAWRAGHQAAQGLLRLLGMVFYVAAAGVFAVLVLDQFSVLDLSEDARDLTVGLWVVACCIVAVIVVLCAARAANAAARPFVNAKDRAH
ncbi:SdpI family protein [Micrococcoides hystricis]|uniref:SdpI family protein n=1 Tax=Micrococcoides hystricis TaxID=1572761 RepID=A0ABV6PAL6_9MICC